MPVIQEGNEWNSLVETSTAQFQHTITNITYSSFYLPQRGDVRLVSLNVEAYADYVIGVRETPSCK